MKSTITAILWLCTHMEKYLAVAPVEEIFAKDLPEKQMLVEYAQKIGRLAATLPEENGLDALVGKITYVRKMGTVLQKADADVARTFYKYDMQQFILTCQKLLKSAA